MKYGAITFGTLSDLQQILLKFFRLVLRIFLGIVRFIGIISRNNTPFADFGIEGRNRVSYKQCFAAVKNPCEHVASSGYGKYRTGSDFFETVSYIPKQGDSVTENSYFTIFAVQAPYPSGISKSGI